MKAYVFPGQGAQFPGMGKPLYDENQEARQIFEQANQVLGFSLTEVMFDGSPDDLKQTKVTQPAVFLHSVALALTEPDFEPQMMAGHSLGEFSALVAAGVLSLEDGLRLVSQRAQAMQEACEAEPSTMAAVLGLDDETVERICSEAEETVVAANYNCPGQLVISGDVPAVKQACEDLKEAGAKRAMLLPVGGAFHSPLMEPAEEVLADAIRDTRFNPPRCPVYQNATAQAQVKPGRIQENLIAQLTSPVCWTQSVQRMIADGATEFIELGPGKTLQGLIKKIDRSVSVSGKQ